MSGKTTSGKEVLTGAAELEIRPGRLMGEVRLPGSKSLTNRALLIAALASGESILSNVLFSEDTDYMASALRELGFSVEEGRKEGRFKVKGLGGVIPSRRAKLFVGNAGTAMRFLTAMLTLGGSTAGVGEYEIDGVGRMRERPIQDLLDCLNQLGADVRSKFNNGCPPVIIKARGLEGGQARMKGDLSSQYFTAILLSAPYARKDVEIKVVGELVSRPYVDMTIRLMKRFGVSVAGAYCDMPLQVKAGQRYSSLHYKVEGDATNASYFLAGAAITPGKVRVHGLSRDSLQGDVRFVDILEEMGSKVKWGDSWVELEGDSLKGIEVDLNDCPDLAQTLAVVALFAEGKTRIRNVANLRIKETDRIHAVVTELEKLGAKVREYEDGLDIEPGKPRPARIETYGDHRMAMSFALAGLRIPGIVIKDPACVAKTFPNYFEELERLRQDI
ncbi:MAG: 3-phosphoshikimate 1-carboxyvinyltransferase [Candidatus Brocadiales bacterium]